MSLSEHIQKTPLFKFNKLKCLRNDYFHNSCNFCINICSENALALVRGKLNLFTDKCSNCGGCVGICPSEALSLESFDEIDFSLNNKEELLTCQKNIPCLAIFDEHHLIYMALKNRELSCDLSKCKDCEVNKNSKIQTQIENIIKNSNRFLKDLEIKKEILIKTDIEINKRRYLFSKFLDKANLNSDEKEVIKDNYLKRVPLKRELLNRALEEIIEDLKVTKVENYSFLIDKIIENSCINCNECVEFCPSDALFKDTGGSTILFQLSKCVNCNICNEICKYKSIKNISEVDLVDFVLNRAKVLIAHDIKTCTECRMPFSYKGGELICSRCAEFKDDFSDIFKLASEV